MTLRKTGQAATVIGLMLLAVGGAASAGPDLAAAAPKGESKLNLCDHALRMLQEGNERFIAGKPVHPNTDVFRVSDTGSNGQHPFAAIITCADSRVAVERLFDRGVGDLFVVRVAGNICDPNECGSVEYACEHLGTQLVVVMGHTKCGAVKAAMGGGNAGTNIGSLLDNIAPAVQTVKAAHPDASEDDLVDAAVHENVWQSIEDMYKGSEAMREMVSRGSVRVIGAVYDVETGRVEWMGQHPMQNALLKGVETLAPMAAAEKSAPSPAEKQAGAGATADKPRSDNKPAADKTGFIKPGAAAKKPEPREEEKPAQAAHPH